MHLSLKGSIDRQPLTDRIGDKLLPAYPGAAAAYSLRALNGNGDNVVRVRRDSDNNERDFNAFDVHNGVMENWVNSQIVLPLDIGVLTDDGRLPVSEGGTSIGEPKAAYSLRKLKPGYDGSVVDVRRSIDGTTQSFDATAVSDGSLEAFVNEDVSDVLPLDKATGAAAAYSLRNLRSAYNGSVVDVRRSSDGEIEPFTATEVADGTLEDWVSDYQTELSVARNYTTNPYESFTNASSSGFTASNSSGTGFAGFDLSGASGDEVEVSFDLNIRIGSPQIKLRTAYNSSGSASSGTTYTTSGTKTITLTAIANFGFIAFSEGDIPSDFDVSNFQIVSRSADGQVKTWYDQSGNTNDAVQTDRTKQPKIVENGDLLDDGIKFDGGDDLSVSNPVITADSSGTYSAFSVQTVALNETGYLYGNASGGTSLYSRSSSYSLSNQSSVSLDNIDRAGVQELLSAVYDNGDAGLLVNSGGTMTDAGTYTFNQTQADFIIGNRNGGTSSGTFLAGSIQEIIIYNSNESPKRRAIEENIASHYNLTLPAHNRQGFVSKWYDQSGSTPANHAVQDTPEEQPLIVDSGVYLGKIDFPSSTSTLGFSNIAFGTTYSFFIALPQLTASDFKILSDGGAAPRIDFETGNTHSVEVVDNNWANDKFETSNTFLNSDSLTSLINSSTTLNVFWNGNTTPESPFTLPNNNTFNTLGGEAAGSAYEVILYDTDQSANRTTIEANIAETYGITGVPAYDNEVNGFVETWYDQSGEGNDAYMSAASRQPKIVDEGDIVRNSDNHISITFDDANNRMRLTNNIVTTGAYSVFAYHRFVNDSYLLKGESNSPRVRITNGNTIQLSSLPPEVFKAFSVPDSKGIVSVFKDVNNDCRVYANGTESTSGVQNVGAGDRHFATLFTSANNGPADGPVSELIVYTSDQSANREDIEDNINNHYDIY